MRCARRSALLLCNAAGRVAAEGGGTGDGSGCAVMDSSAFLHVGLLTGCALLCCAARCISASPGLPPWPAASCQIGRLHATVAIEANRAAAAGMRAGFSEQTVKSLPQQTSSPAMCSPLASTWCDTPEAVEGCASGN
jgi:hypothetical protein